VLPSRSFSLLDLLRNQVGIDPRGLLAPSLPVFKTPLYLMD
jgi:hypothetical protein